MSIFSYFLKFDLKENQIKTNVYKCCRLRQSY